MRRLLTHLAQFSSFARQGELLCTQSLAHLLQNDQARAVFAGYVSGVAGPMLRPDLTWRAEVRQPEDLGRPDLEGCTSDKKQVVKVEAKLGAAMVPGQIRSYVADLENRCEGGLLLIIVPRRREEKAADAVAGALAGTGPSPWRRLSGCTVALIFWEDVIDALRAVRAESFRGDLDQFEAMYKVLNRHIPPIADNIELPERRADLVTLVDRVTRRIAEERTRRLLPMGEEGGGVSYERRYICLPLGDEHPCMSVGVRHPFAGHTTFIWVRFNSTTPKFVLIHARVAGSPLSGRLGDGGGHLWIPVDLPLHTDEEGMADSLYGQLQSVIEVAYAPLA